MTSGRGGSGRAGRSAGGSPPGREDLLTAIERMAGVPVLVIGDLVLDEFEYGEIGRVSREAPVLILEHRRTDRLPGGGANAAANISALGGRAAVIGRVGNDEAGTQLSAMTLYSPITSAGVTLPTISINPRIIESLTNVRLFNPVDGSAGVIYNETTAMTVSAFGVLGPKGLTINVTQAVTAGDKFSFHWAIESAII